jgi:uncharacterized delta-60 repeat protein
MGLIAVLWKTILINGVTQKVIARLTEDGGLDDTFVPGMEPENLAPDVTSITLQPDGKVLLTMASLFADSFEWPDFVTLYRLNADGSWDPSFRVDTGERGYIHGIALQTDGKVLASGGFSSINGTARTGIARLNGDGSLDMTFAPIVNSYAWVGPVLIQPDGRSLVGGTFTSVNGITRHRVARLNTDGSLDETFDPGSGPDGSVTHAVLQPDGKVVVAGTFTNVSGMGWRHIARLNADGTPDVAFNPGTGVDGAIRSLALDRDGRILLAGPFTYVNGTRRKGVARLNADGTLDAMFNPGTGVETGMFDRGAYCVGVQQDGKVLVGGDFFSFNGVPRRSIVRLNTDGSLDPTFDTGLGPQGSVFALALQSDGRVLLGGGFAHFNYLKRGPVARLLGDPPVLVFGPVRDTGALVAQFRGILGLNYTIEYREDLASGTWQKLMNVIALETDDGLGEGVFELRDGMDPVGGRFYRVVEPAY